MSRPEPFDDLRPSAAAHLRLHVAAVAVHLLAHLRSSLPEPEIRVLLARHPFLLSYVEPAAQAMPEGMSFDQVGRWWRRTMRRWEGRAGGTHLPLRELRRLGLSVADGLAVVAAGLAAEDGRFAALYAELHGEAGGPARPTLGVLAGICGRDPWDLRRLHDLGVLEIGIGGGAGTVAVAHVDNPLWALLRGRLPAPAAGEIVSAVRLRRLEEEPLDDDVRAALRGAVALLRGGQARTVVLRGPSSSGRRRLLGGVARSLGRAALLVDGGTLDPDRWRRLPALGAAAAAMPIVRLDLVPGETAAVPRLPARAPVLGIVVGRGGGVTGPAMDGAIRVDLPALTPAERLERWRHALAGVEVDERTLAHVADRPRMRAGNIRRAAADAVTSMRMAGRRAITVADVQGAVRRLNHQRLDVLAQRLTPIERWDRLVADPDTTDLLLALERRCRHREQLTAHVGIAFGGTADVGVRALLAGPSGTGKTLAARILAGRLGLEVYRLDLAAVVSKYVGETEKSLHRVLDAAEELDVVLLIDEGDSLLGRRTDVRGANDRFANLQTNYLLQRLEEHDGIVVVTTNAADRIDQAFQRRMDAVVTLPSPGPDERLRIWQLHLPEAHIVPPADLYRLAHRATMTGGQIRSAALQAALMSLDGAGVVGPDQLRTAVALEYAKAGGLSPVDTVDPTSMPVRSSHDFLGALP